MKGTGKLAAASVAFEKKPFAGVAFTKKLKMSGRLWLMTRKLHHAFTQVASTRH